LRRPLKNVESWTSSIPEPLSQLDAAFPENPRIQPLEKSCRPLRWSGLLRVPSGQARIPLAIGRPLDHPPIIVRRAVVPPNRPALAERDLGGAHPQPGHGGRRGVVARCPNRPTRRHELGDEGGSLFLRQCRVAQLPQPAADHEVAAVRRPRIGALGRRVALGVVVGHGRSIAGSRPGRAPSRHGVAAPATPCDRTTSSRDPYVITSPTNSPHYYPNFGEGLWVTRLQKWALDARLPPQFVCSRSVQTGYKRERAVEPRSPLCSICGRGYRL